MNLLWLSPSATAAYRSVRKSDLKILHCMAIRLPQRPRAHELADRSETFLRQHLPPSWTCDRPQPDYGVDLRVGLAKDGHVNGQQLVIQLKASDRDQSLNWVNVRLEVSTLTLLRGMLEVAMLVKYVAAEDEAYWLLLKDFTLRPRPSQQTVSVRIPKANRVSAQIWDEVAAHVEAVHFRKLQANMPTFAK